MKILYNFDFPEHLTNEFFIPPSILGGTVKFYRKGSFLSKIDISGNITKRNDINFYPVIKNTLIKLINHNVRDFMCFYNELKFDAIFFKLADDIRQQKLNETVELLTV